MWIQLIFLNKSINRGMYDCFSSHIIILDCNILSDL